MDLCPESAEIWNRLGTKILPKLRSGTGLQLRLDFTVAVGGTRAEGVKAELEQIIDEMGLSDQVNVILGE